MVGGARLVRIEDEGYRLQEGRTYTVKIEFEGRDAQPLSDVLILENTVGKRFLMDLHRQFPRLRVLVVKSKSKRLMNGRLCPEGRLARPDQGIAIVAFKVIANPNPVIIGALKMLGLAILAGVLAGVLVVIKSVFVYVHKAAPVLAGAVVLGGLVVVGILVFRFWQGSELPIRRP